MDINITDLHIDLIIEILLKIPYDFPIFALFRVNKHLYGYLKKYQRIITFDLFKPRFLYVTRDPNQCVLS